MRAQRQSPTSRLNYRALALRASLNALHKKTTGRISMKITIPDGRLVKTTLAAALLVAMAQPGLAADLKYKPISVKTPDGLTISAQEWGNPAGPEILFIHGFSQSHLSWMRQVDTHRHLR